MLKNLSIRGKLIFIILVFTITALIIGFIAVYISFYSALKEDLKHNMVNTSKIVADYSITPLQFNDKKRKKTIVQ